MPRKEIFFRITVCGGGNAAHVAVPLLAHRGLPVTLYAPFADEAERFRESSARGGLTLHLPGGKIIKGTPRLVTTDPAEAAAADLVLLLVPAFAHGPLLESLAPHLKPGTAVGAIPSRSGFELQALRALQALPGGGCTIFCGLTLPWACRIETYGSSARVLGTKESVGLAAVPAHSAPALAASLSEAFGVKFTPLANCLTVSLGNIGQVIHPGIMYGLLKDYRGETWRETEVPLFYQGVTEETAQILEELSAEIAAAARRLSREFDLDLAQVETVRQWLIRSYARYIADRSTLARAFRTNQSYRGLKLPVKKTKEGYIPDFASRYLTEDVPYGLLYSRAVAAMAGSPTPRIDEVVIAAQRWMNKCYLDSGGGLSGPDIKEVRIPQNYGVFDASKLVRASLGGYG